MSAIMLETSDPLQGQLKDPLTQRVRLAILTKMFGIGITCSKQEPLVEGFNSYCKYWYEPHCDGRTGPIARMSHSQLLEIIVLLKDPAATHDSVKTEIKRTVAVLESDIQIQGALILAARIWSLSSVGKLDQCVSSGESVPWHSGTLVNALKTHYLLPRSSAERVRIPKTFKAVNIVRMTNLEIRWTSNLLDHLQMTNDDTVVSIYHHASLLKLHKRANSQLLPVDFIEETLDTLALLLPDNDPASKRWFQGVAKKLELDPEAISNGNLNTSSRRLEKFKYWGDKLSILKQAFDDSEPKSVSQWWYDDRKKVQWCTFWIAALVLLLTVVFGLVQSVAAVVQAWATIKSLSKN